MELRFGRSNQIETTLHTSQNRPFFCAFYRVTTFSSAKRVSGWPRERNLRGVTGKLRRLDLRINGLEFIAAFSCFLSILQLCVQGFGLGFGGKKYRVDYFGKGLGYLVQQGLGFRVQGLGFMVYGSGFRVQSLEFRVQGLGCRVQGLEFRARTRNA